MSNKKPRSIRMTDESYEVLSSGARERNLLLGDYIVERCSRKTQEISPDIICRLHTLGVLKDIPLGQWNDQIKRFYDDCLEGLCALLKW